MAGAVTAASTMTQPIITRQVVSIDQASAVEPFPHPPSGLAQGLASSAPPQRLVRYPARVSRHL